MKKPPIELLNDYKAYVNNDTVFASNARLLQSIWRKEKFGDVIDRDNNKIRELGNMLPLDFAIENKANYLNNNIFEIVKYSVANSKETGAKIAEPRIWNNLLSSQPLCFNLFGELSLDMNLASGLFSSIFKGHVKRITGAEFEYSPGRSNQKYTNDKSAFDAFFRYESTNGKNGFIGIEVKYAENLRDRPSTHKPRYDEISEKSKLFRDSEIEIFKRSNLQQIWRDHLLSLCMYKANNDYDEGMFVYLYPENNLECVNGVNSYTSLFKTDDTRKNGFYPITIETLMSHLKEIDSSKWITDFEDRYLDFRKISKI